MQARRHQYLKTIGVQVWQLRDRHNVDEIVGDVPADSFTPAVQPLDMATMASSEVLVANPTIDEAKHAPPLVAANATHEKVSSSAEAASATPVFRLASIIFSGTCMAITQVPVASARPINAQQIAFLKSVFLSAGADLKAEPEVTFFKWPMLRSAGFDQSEAAASQACKAFLNGQQSKHKSLFVLLMGADTVPYLLPHDENIAAEQGQLLTGTTPPLLLTHSLDDVFAAPNLKADLWRDIQPLKRFFQPA